MTVAVIVGTALLVYAIWKGVRIGRMIRQLRLRRISSAMLQRKLDDHDKVMVVDLLDYEAQDSEVKGIPCAFRAKPSRLRMVKALSVPPDVEIALYCSSNNEFVSARVADALRKEGIHNVWVLEGDLEASVRDGRPVTTELDTGERVAARMGVVLPLDFELQQ